jgi:predicted TIM-barrel fold metal-dependent hydrolase
MKIIDFRFRPNTAEVIDGIKNSAMFKATCKAIHFERRIPQPLPEIVADMERRGVELAVITGRDCETTYGFPANNGSVLSFVKAYPTKFVGFWGIDPHKGMDAVREVVRVVEKEGMRGIAIDPYLAHIPPHEARYYPLYAKCCELGIPVFITTAPPPQVPRAVMDYVDPRHVDIVARDFPELVIIMSHGGYPFVNEAIFACMRNANVYMDLSEYELAPMAEVYVQALNTAIGDKVVFASAHPFVEQAEAIRIYQNLRLSDEVRRKVMYENARRILGLAPAPPKRPGIVAGLAQGMPVPYLPFCPTGGRSR